MLILFTFIIIALPVITIGLPAALHAWPVAVSGAVFALVVYIRLDKGSAKKDAAREYQQRNDALNARSAAMVSEYHEVMAGVQIQVARDRRDRRGHLEERQRHEREMRELRAELEKAHERIKRLTDRRKRPPEPPKPPKPPKPLKPPWPEDDEE